VGSCPAWGFSDRLRGVGNSAETPFQKLNSRDDTCMQCCATYATLHKCGDWPHFDGC
jgi:hypothetical protein